MQNTENERARVAEAKATRHLLVHNRGIVNGIYLQKAGSFARFKLGESASVTMVYARDSWQALSSTVLTCLDRVIATFQAEGDTNAV